MSNTERLVRDAIVKVCGVDPERVHADAPLDDLGVDSLAAAEVLVEVEIQIGRDLPVDVLRRLDKAVTVRDIAAQLELAAGTAGPQP
jgi:acyl carrier protein